MIDLTDPVAPPPASAIVRSLLALPHGITLACRSVGPLPGGEGAPGGADDAADARPRVLLLHGFPEAAFAWDGVLQRTAAQVRAVAPNLRGFAGSSAPAEPQAYRARHLVADVAALVDRVARPGRPLDLLVAHDWGGAVAWAFAAAQPQRLRRLLILNSPHPATFLRELREDPAQQRASAYMNFLCRPDAAALLAENGHARLLRFLAGEDGQPPAWLDAAMVERYRQVWAAGLEGGLHYYRASPLRPATGAGDALHTLVLPDEAVTIRVPTTVLWGEADRALLPGLLHGLERWVPQLEVRRLPQASHWLVHEQPQVVAQTLVELATAG